MSIHLAMAFFAFGLGALSLFIASRLGFFEPLKSRSGKTGWLSVFYAFGIFLSLQLLLVPLTLGEFKDWTGQELMDIKTRGWLNLLSIYAVATAVFAYYFYKSDKLHWFSLRKAGRNFLLGALSWLIAFPLIVGVTEVLTVVLTDFMGFELVDQLAVRQVKVVQAYPILLTVTVATIALVVPLIEELLFRGFLQEALVSWMRPSKAIMFSSCIFALFHFSLSQGVNNLLILISLFLLSCMLGYLKERQGSLWAPVGLHSAFNGISLVQILLIQ